MARRKMAPAENPDQRPQLHGDGHTIRVRAGYRTSVQKHHAQYADGMPVRNAQRDRCAEVRSHENGVVHAERVECHAHSLGLRMPGSSTTGGVLPAFGSAIRAAAVVTVSVSPGATTMCRTAPAESNESPNSRIAMIMRWFL